MGTFRIDVEIENPQTRGPRVQFDGALVDTGSELSWIPRATLESIGVNRERLARFRQASGQVIERWVGFAIIHVGGLATNDDVVFGESGDLSLLGARTLEGLNVMIDPVSKRLVDAGPVLGAAAAA